MIAAAPVRPTGGYAIASWAIASSATTPARRSSCGRTNEGVAHLPSHKPPIIASLKASTENLGDYIQIAACLRLLDTLDLRPSLYLDRDTELASPPLGELGSAPIVLPLSGWFKHMVGDDPQWPPHHRIVPVFVGFHVRPHQCPALLQPASI